MPNIPGARLERGTGASPAPPGAGSAAGAARAAFGPQAGASGKAQPGVGEDGVSAVALAKRVAADQLIM